MWVVIQELLAHYGLIGFLCLLEAVAIFWFYKKEEAHHKEINVLHEALNELNEKRLVDANARLVDAIEDRERYEDLARQLSSNVDILIKMIGSYSKEHKD